MKKGAHYYGIFKYSPNNLSPKLVDEKHWKYKIIQEEIQRNNKWIEEISKEWEKGAWLEHETKRVEVTNFNLQVLDTEQVFYVADKDFNILVETHDVWNHGDFSKSVKNIMKEYGINSKSNRIRTDSTLSELKENIRVHEELSKITPERLKEMEQYFKK